VQAQVILGESRLRTTGLVAVGPVRIEVPVEDLTGHYGGENEADGGLAGLARVRVVVEATLAARSAASDFATTARLPSRAALGLRGSLQQPPSAARLSKQEVDELVCDGVVGLTAAMRALGAFLGDDLSANSFFAGFTATGRDALGKLRQRLLRISEPVLGGERRLPALSDLTVDLARLLGDVINAIPIAFFVAGDGGAAGGGTGGATRGATRGGTRSSSSSTRVAANSGMPSDRVHKLEGVVRRDILYAAALDLQQEARSVNDAVADGGSEEAAWIKYTDAAARGGGRLLFILQLLIATLDWDGIHGVHHWRGAAHEFVVAWRAAGVRTAPFEHALAASRDRSAIAASTVWTGWICKGGPRRDSRVQRRLRTARDAVAVRDTSAGAVPSRTMDYAPVGEDVAKEVIMLEVALGAEGSFFVRDEVVQQRLATEVAAAGGSREAATLKLVERKCNLQQQYNLSMAKLAKEGRLGRGNHIDSHTVSREAPTEEMGQGAGMRTLLSDAHAARRAAAESCDASPVFVPLSELGLPESYFGTGPESLQHMVLTFLGLEERGPPCGGERPSADPVQTESAALREHYARLITGKPDKSDKRNRDGGEGLPPLALSPCLSSSCKFKVELV
jgi:hypothetical protein